MTDRGMLIVISGPSGVGKDTVVNRFMAQCSNCVKSISATTRPKKPGEEHGREYYFVNKAEFEAMIAADELVEYAIYDGNYYGPPRAMIEEQRAAGKHVLLVIDVQGGAAIRKLYPEALLVFIRPPSMEALRCRLEKRGRDDAGSVERRLEAARQELIVSQNYDYILTNDDYEACADDLAGVIRAATFSAKHSPGLLRGDFEC